MTQATETTKRVPAVTTDYNDATGVFTVRFADGEGFDIVVGDLSPEIQQRALVHGLNAKLVDAAAISRNPTNGASATVADKKAAVMEVAERLVNGEWNKRREAGEDAGTILFQALVRAYPTTPTGLLRERFDAWTDAEKKALRVNPRIAPHIAAIQAERAKAKGISSDDLLAQLG